MKTSIYLFFFLLLVSSVAVGQKVSIKDSMNNILMEVNDEGSAGSLTIPSTALPFNTYQKLFNKSGDLYWQNTPLGYINDAGGWKISGGAIYTKNLLHEVAIGRDVPLAKLHVYQSGLEDVFRADDTAGDTSPFIIKDDGKVGIGTPDPAEVLHVIGDMRLEQPANPILKFYLNNTYAAYTGILDTNLYVSNVLGGKLFLLTNNSVRMTFDGPKTGIGTQTPSQRLEISGKIKFADDALPASAGVMRYHAANDAFEGHDGSNWRSFWDGKWQENGDDISYMDGNVGIGTTTPAATLDVRGSAIFNEDGVNADFRVESDTDSDMFFVNGGRDEIGIGVQSTSAKLHVVQLSGGDAFKVDDEDADTSPFIVKSDGDVGIGTSNPSHKLNVVYEPPSPNIGPIALFETNGPNSAAALRLENTSGNYYSFGMTSPSAPNSSDNAFAFTYNSNVGLASDLMTLHPDGDLGVGTTSPSAKTHIIQEASEDAFRIDDDAGDITPYVTKADGDIGVGTTIPSAKMHISQENAGEDAFRVDDQIGDATPFIVKYDGKVGIGTLSPETKLHVEGYLTVDDKIVADDANGLKLCTDEQSTRIAITDNGNVGIGTLNPGTRLEVNGDITVTDDLLVNDEVNASPTGNANLIPAAYGLVVNTNTTPSFMSSTGNVTVTKIAEGEFGIDVNNFTATASNGIILAMAVQYGRLIAGETAVSGYDFKIHTLSRATGNHSDVDFYFIIYTY